MIPPSHKAFIGLALLIWILPAEITRAVVAIPSENFGLVDSTEPLQFVVDPMGNKTITEIKQQNQWQIWEGDNILNFGMTQSVYWIRLELHNFAAGQYLRLKSPLLDYIDIYFVQQDQIDHRQSGAAYPFAQREIQTLNYLFKIPQGTSKTYIRLHSNFALQVPVEIASLKYFNQSDMRQYWGLGLYFGLMLVMVLYNLFIYFSTRDRAYLYYILYISLISLTYASFKGIAFQCLWPNLTDWNKLVPTFASMAGMFIFLFGSYFLGVKEYRSPVPYWISLMHVMVLGICSLANVLGDYYISANTSQLVTATGSFYLLYISVFAYLKGIKTARFFLLAWTLYLISVVIYILQLQSIIPHTEFTNNAILYGSAIEAVLISFALADRINILKDEKEASQQQALQALEDNQRIVQEQNIILESRVQERTRELDQSNHILKQTLEELKLTQSKVVETEKMASLGQLTAGIAHEINNPLTFIKANIKPLKRNLITLQEVIDRCGAVVTATQWRQQSETIANFKQEIEYDYVREETQLLLQGIEEGANRTVTIVEGLKSFSRLGSGDFQLYALESGIESTLTLLTHQIRDHGITIHRDYGNNIQANCLPDRINQVFMNILSNAIDALEEKNGGNPEISIVLSADQDWVTVEISDNGVGIDKATMNKLFDPFFTTKEVGSGTGLGLSIVYGIIQDHNGTITVDSIPNKSTVFTLKLPV